MPHLLQATVLWRQSGASVSEDEMTGTTVFVGVARFHRQHHVFGSATGWCCLSAADSKTEGEVDYRALVKGKWKDGSTRTETCPSATLPTTTRPELKAVFRGKWLVTSRLCHGTA